MVLVARGAASANLGVTDVPLSLCTTPAHPLCMLPSARVHVHMLGQVRTSPSEQAGADRFLVLTISRPRAWRLIDGAHTYARRQRERGGAALPMCGRPPIRAMATVCDGGERIDVTESGGHLHASRVDLPHAPAPLHAICALALPPGTPQAEQYLNGQHLVHFDTRTREPLPSSPLPYPQPADAALTPHRVAVPPSQGAYHSFWDLQHLDLSAPWTRYCGKVRVASMCLIAKHFLRQYGGMTGDFVGNMPSLDDCLSADGAGETQRLGCVLSVSYGNYRAYDEALYAAAHGQADGPGQCGTLLLSRKPTTITGVATELLDSRDWDFVRQHPATVAPNGTLVRWCAKVLPHTSAAWRHTGVTRRRLLRCLRGAAATISTGQLRQVACAQVAAVAEFAEVLSPGDIDRDCIHAPLAFDSLLHEDACSAEPPCAVADVVAESRHWQGKASNTFTQWPWYW